VLSHWMPFYTGDYLRDTRGLTIQQHGVYFLLLTNYWDTKSPLPLDIDEVCRIVGAFSTQEREDIDLILCKFFKRKSDGFHQKKVDFLLEQVEEKRRKLSDNGRKGAQAKAKQLLKQKLSNCSSKWVSKPQPQPEVFPSGKEPLTSLGVLSPTGKELLFPTGKERLTSLGASIPQTQPEVFPSGKEPLTSLGASAFVLPSENAARDIVWADGLELLMSSGENEKAARRLLGMMVKKYTKEVVEEAILDTVVKKTGDPTAYLNGVLNGKIKKTRDTHGFKTVQEWENHKALFEGGI